MEGWNGEDENSFPTVNVYLCRYISGFAWGSRGVISKSLSGFFAMDRFTYTTKAYGDLYSNIPVAN